MDFGLVERTERRPNRQVDAPPPQHTRSVQLLVSAGDGSSAHRHTPVGKLLGLIWVRGTRERCSVLIAPAVANYSRPSPPWGPITGWQDAETLRRTCAPNCGSSQLSAIRTRLFIADISLLAGVGFSALTGWLLWNSHSTKSAVPADVRSGLSAAIGPGSAQVRYSANF